MKKIKLLILFSAFYVNVMAQFEQGSSSLPPAPNSAAAIKFSNTPVNLYSGLPGINNPIHEIKGRGISIPIALSYHASGIKVQEVAGSVGLGWSLTTNCVVSRVVNGLPDESLTGYFGSDMGEKVGQPMTTLLMNEIATNKADAEPDLFYYNMNGIDGKFVLNKNKVPVMLTNDGIKILNNPFAKELGIDGWVFADIVGNRYFFGTDESSKELTTSVTQSESPSVPLNFISSWYINKISLANDREEIIYAYDTGQEIRVKNYRSSLRFRNRVENTYTPPIYFLGIRLRDFDTDQYVQELDRKIWDTSVEDVVSAPRYLKSIKSANESAYFYYSSTTRQDLTNGLVLNKIVIKNFQEEITNSFRLNYKYISAPEEKELNLALTNRAITALMNMYNSGMALSYDPRVPAGLLITLRDNSLNTLSEYDYHVQYCNIIGRQPNLLAPQAQDGFRLILEQVWSDNANETSSLPMYRFEYNEQKNLPKRTSLKTDHWGYYNNNIYEPFSKNREEAAASKTPDATNMQANMLKKIIYPTGAYKEFFFEPNSYYNSNNNENVISGGLRVAKIIDVPGYNVAPVISKYSYGNSGKKLVPDPSYVSYLEHNITTNFTPYINFRPIGFPQYNFTQVRGDLVLPIPLSTSIWNSLISSLPSLLAPGGRSEVYYSPFIVQSSLSFNHLFDLSGSSVGYDEVSVDNGEGRSVFKFTSIDDYPDYSNQYRLNKYFQADLRIAASLSPFTPTTSYAFARGLLKENTIYNKNGQIVKKISNKYAFNSVADSVKGFRCAIGRINLVNGTFSSYSDELYNAGHYHFISKPLLQIETIEDSYFQNSSVPVTKKTQFTYNQNYPSLLKTSNTTNSDLSNHSVEYKYVIDREQINYSLSSEITAANNLFLNGRLGLILEETSKNGTEVVGRSRVGYNTWLVNNKTLILPHHSYQGASADLEMKTVYKAYDEFGNILQQAAYGEPNVNYKWTNNKSQQIAQISNAETNEIFAEDFEEFNGSGLLIGNANSGKKYFTGDYISLFTPPNSKPFKISYWYLSNGVWNYSGWLPYTGVSMVLSLGDAVDDVLIIPKESANTYVIHQKEGIKSSTDANGRSVFYDYDEFSRLKNVRDDNRDIVKHYKYNDVSSYVGNVFFNDEMSAGFAKNDCSVGTPGTSVLFTVPADKYFSYISKSDANLKANNDLILNGQINANMNGNCNYSGVYNLEHFANPNTADYLYFKVSKPYQDNKRAQVTIRIVAVDLNGSTSEYYRGLQLEPNTLYAEDYLEVGQIISYYILEIIDITYN